MASDVGCTLGLFFVMRDAVQTTAPKVCTRSPKLQPCGSHIIPEYYSRIFASWRRFPGELKDSHLLTMGKLQDKNPLMGIHSKESCIGSALNNYPKYFFSPQSPHLTLEN